MLTLIGVDTLDELASAAVPASILDIAGDGLEALPAAVSEHDALRELAALAARNTVTTSMIGLGYYDTLTPPVILRNVVESPAWYTAYTPYQPEISQGRLEALLNFQTMVSDLTGMELANSSMLDEATAAAEAMTLLRRAGKSRSPRFIVDADVLPQTRAVLATRADPLGIELVDADLSVGELPEGEFFGVLLQLPGSSGHVVNHAAVIEQAHKRGALVAVAADLLALCLMTPPGEQGADACLGTSQRFGVPMGYGGPHAGYLAVRQNLTRQLPGRLVGVSVDADGAPAYRLALQTREQHIRREKATSNICTAQVLLAVVAAMYASYHGADGLRTIAARVHRCACVLAEGLQSGGVQVVHQAFFDTVLARVPGRASTVVAAARTAGISLRLVDADHVGIACDEATTPEHITGVWSAFGVSAEVDAVDACTAD
ncbi:MAG: glycine dehydrogenase, partial [Mycobacteriaceae bacterium]